MRVLPEGQDRFTPQPFAVPDLSAQQPQFNDPASFAVKPGPVGAQYLAPPDESAPAPMPQAAPPAAALASPPPAQAAPEAAAQTPQQPEWMTPARKKMYEKAKRASQNYRAAVDERRKKRKLQQDYNKLYNQFENAIGKAEDLENLSKYSGLYPPDDARTLELTRMQARHVEAAERLKKQLRDNLRKAGVKIGDKDPLPDNPFGDPSADDHQFDNLVQDGYTDALMTNYEQ